MIQKTIKDRTKTYGEFKDISYISQNMKIFMTVGKNWYKLTNHEREALEMIIHKIARIVNGEPNQKDSWHDIIGYAQLIEDRLELE